MSKAEIIAELSRLSPQERAEIQAWLARQDDDRPFSVTRATGAQSICINSPRLANPARAADFVKQVTEL